VRRALLVAAVLALGIALLAWSSLRHSGSGGEGALCEVCMDAAGRSHCARVQAGSESAALEAAQRSACGVLGRGIAAELSCMQRAPRSAQCSAAR